MKIVHQGYRISGMVGHMTAEIVENGGDAAYVEVILTDGDHHRSYDLNGLGQLIQDLTTVLDRAEAVEMNNAQNRNQNREIDT